MQRSIIVKAFLCEENAACDKITGVTRVAECWGALNDVEPRDSFFGQMYPLGTRAVVGAKATVRHLARDLCSSVVIAKGVPKFVESVVEYYAMLAKAGVHHSGQPARLLGDKLLADDQADEFDMDTGSRINVVTVDITNPA